MIKLTIISDTHGNSGAVDKLTEVFTESDYVIHAGDGVSDTRALRSVLADKLIAVSGNCDFSNFQKEICTEIDGLTFLITHGHKYSVKSGLELLKARAQELNADIIIYGHTHIADIEKDGSRLFICPGALSGGRGTPASYCYLILQDGKAYPRIVNL